MEVRERLRLEKEWQSLSRDQGRETDIEKGSREIDRRQTGTDRWRKKYAGGCVDERHGGGGSL